MIINEVWLLSNGWVSVKVDGEYSYEHSGVYSEKFIKKLKEKADKNTTWHNFDKGLVEHVLIMMKNNGKPK